MTSTMLSALPPAALQETIPARLLPKKITSASVITSRNTKRQFPIQSGNFSYPGARIITFKIRDTQGFIDLPTAALHMRVESTGSGLVQVPDELISSLINRITIRCNGVPVEDTMDVNVKACAEFALTATQDFVNGANGQQVGAWKRAFVPQGGLATTTAPYPGIDNQANIIARASNYQPFVETSGSQGADVSGDSFLLPLGFLSGLFKTQSQFPLRLAGELEIQLELEDPRAAQQVTSGSTTAQTLKDVNLQLDTLNLADHVVSMQDRLAASESGIFLPQDATQSQRVEYPVSNPGTQTQNTVLIQRGTTNLLSLLLVKRKGENLLNPNVTSLSTFNSFSAASYQVKIGSARFPELPDDSQARMWASTAKAQGLQANRESGGTITRSAQQDFSNNDFVGNHIYGLGFQQDVFDNVDTAGISTIAAGGNLELTFTDITGGVTTRPVMNAFVRSRRFLKFASSGASVLGT